MPAFLNIPYIPMCQPRVPAINKIHPILINDNFSVSKVRM
jgi:hypothetical protein